MEPDANGLLSNTFRENQLALPDVKRITEIPNYIKELLEYNGNMEAIIDNFAGQVKQCEDLKDLLKKQAKLKMDTLHQVKDDIEDINRQLQEISEPFKKNKKFLVQFLDETEINEYECCQALARYSVKMSSLYGEILSIDTDIDHLIYLTNIAKLNEEFVRNAQKPKVDAILEEESL